MQMLSSEIESTIHTELKEQNKNFDFEIIPEES